MALNIANIITTPVLLTTNTAGQTPPNIVPLVVWDPNHNFVDGNGSTAPVTFLIPVAPTAQYNVPVAMQASCTFPQNYVGQFTVVGSLPNVGDLFRSPAFPIPPSTNPPTPTVIAITSFSMPAPTPTFVCPVPFRYAGDFGWRIDVTGQPSITSPLSTRLELCWANAQATLGVNFQPSAILRTSLDFNGMYDVRLQRLFFPQPAEFTTQAQFNTSYLSWWMRRSIQAIWTWGNPHVDGRPQYQTNGGGSSYGVGSAGGSFDVTAWYNGQFTTLGCYDLAGIAQIAACLLISRGGGEALQPDWVYQDRNQYVSPGILYGLPVPPLTPGVNNPFYTNPPAPAYIAPSPAVHPELQGRQPFGNHAWIEVTTELRRGVADATYAIPNAAGVTLPDMGDRNRQDYSNAHCDALLYHYWPTLVRGNTANFISYIPGPQTADCYVNNTFSLNYNANPPIKPANGYQRVGVYDIRGATGRLDWNSIMMIPASRAHEVDAAMERAKPPTPVDTAIADVDLTGQPFIDHIIAHQPALQHNHTSLKFAPGLVRQSLHFDNAPFNATSRAALHVTVSAFAQHAHALDAFRTHLLTWQLPLSRVLSPLPSPLGSYSLRSQNTVIWVRNNHFVRVHLDAADVVDGDVSAALTPLAAAIDAYLTSATVPEGSRAIRCPSVEFEPEFPAKVRAPARLEVKLREHVVRNHAEAQLWSSDPTVLLPYAGSSAEGGLTVYAQKAGRVRMTVMAGHRETLYPGFAEIDVEVEGGESQGEGEGEGEGDGQY